MGVSLFSCPYILTTVNINKNSVMLTTEKFKSQMQLKEPNIEILSEY